MTTFHTIVFENADAAAGVAGVTFVDGYEDSANAATFNFADVDIGATASAGATRYLVIGPTSRQTSGGITISGLNVDGNAATAVSDGTTTAYAEHEDAAACQAGLFIIAHATATTASIDYTYSGSVLRSSITVHRVVGINGISATDVGISTATSPSAALTIPAGGIAIAVSAAGSNPSATWEGITERVDAVNEAMKYSGADDDYATATTATLRVVWTGTPNADEPVGVFAAWAPE